MVIFQYKESLRGWQVEAERDKMRRSSVCGGGDAGRWTHPAYSGNSIM